MTSRTFASLARKLVYLLESCRNCTFIANLMGVKELKTANKWIAVLPMELQTCPHTQGLRTWLDWNLESQQTSANDFWLLFSLVQAYINEQGGVLSSPEIQSQELDPPYCCFHPIIPWEKWWVLLLTSGLPLQKKSVFGRNFEESLNLRHSQSFLSWDSLQKDVYKIKWASWWLQRETEREWIHFPPSLNVFAFKSQTSKASV